MLNTAYLTEPFKKYLTAEKISPGSIRSYHSDVKHFLGWLILFLRSNKVLSSEYELTRTRIYRILKYINHKVLVSYREYLVANQSPTKTINRRFSALRKFGKFAQNQNWLTENAFETLQNVSLDLDPDHLILFKQELLAKNASANSIKNYLADIRAFINWLRKQPAHGL